MLEWGGFERIKGGKEVKVKWKTFFFTFVNSL
jgi:hypothetical protein